MTTREAELLPCPFCGAVPDRYQRSYVSEYEVHCGGCGASIEANSRKQADDRWNTRTPPPLQDARERAEKLVEQWRDDYEPPLLSDEAPALIAAIATALTDAARVPDAFVPTHQHYKGGLYQMLFEAIEEVTIEPLIVYRSENGQNWVRYKSVFEQIMKDGKPRFRPLAAAPNRALRSAPQEGDHE